MNRPSTLDGSALPFVFDSMQLEGHYPGSLDALDGDAMNRRPLAITGPAHKILTNSMPLSGDLLTFK
jgi:hypothetical protein